MSTHFVHALAALSLGVWLALVTGCGGLGAPPPPVVDLSTMPDDVRATIDTQLRAVEARPADAVERASLGLALEANALYEAAATAYEQAVALEPHEPRWHYHLSRVLAELGRSEAGLAALDEAIVTAPNYAPARRLRGERLLAMGRLDEADRSFREAVRVAPGDVGARVGIARVALQGGDPASAIEILEPLVEHRPELGLLRRLLADAHRQAGRLEEAQAQLELAGDDDPPAWPDPWTAELDRFRVGYAAELKRAMRLLGAGRYDEAISRLETLRRQRPDDVTLLTNLGAAYVDTRRLDEGVATLREALRHEPDHFGAHLNIAAAFDRAGRFDSALEHVERALAANPGLGDAHLLRGRLLARARRLDDALAAFDRAHRALPRQTTPLVFSGWIHSERGEWPLALDAFRRAASVDSADGAAQLGLALALAETGDLAGAEAAMDHAVRLSPGEPQMAIVSRRLAELRRGR